MYTNAMETHRKSLRTGDVSTSSHSALPPVEPTPGKNHMPDTDQLLIRNAVCRKHARYLAAPKHEILPDENCE
jgi:hypothetical protein